LLYRRKDTTKFKDTRIQGFKDSRIQKFKDCAGPRQRATVHVISARATPFRRLYGQAIVRAIVAPSFREE
jgi:hypothetical protein